MKMLELKQFFGSKILAPVDFFVGATYGFHYTKADGSTGYYEGVVKELNGRAKSITLETDKGFRQFVTARIDVSSVTEIE